MIYIYLDGHTKMNDVQTAVQIFMPNEKYKPAEGITDEGITVRSELKSDCAVAHMYENGKEICSESYPYTADESGKSARYAIKAAVYYMLKKKTGITVPWGMMTGIRPAKRINTYIDEGMTADERAL